MDNRSNARLALGTLTLLEIVLGIDNIIFLSLVVAKLPTAQRAHARRLGLAGAMVMRLALLASIALGYAPDESAFYNIQSGNFRP